MKLLWSSRSPFVRKVMIVAHEAGLAERIATERVVVAPAKPNALVMAANPLNKLPTLILDDGRVLYDSRVISEYLDGLNPGPKLFPAAGPARFEALRRQALGDGMLDFLLLWLAERNRPVPQQSAELLAALKLKLEASLAQLEREAADIATTPLGIGHIAVAVALGYLDFRFAVENWRTLCPGLAQWHADFAARPSYAATAHADVY
jgi:glutathione S-transferase